MDVEKTIQFLLENQARFDARQAQLDERYAQLVEQQAQFVDRQSQFVDRQSQFEERMTRIENVLLDVAEAQTRTNAILTTLTERHVELAQSHNATEQSLNALIAVVERHIADHK